MKVAFCNRPNYDNPLGGDAIQMLKTKEYLEKEYPINIDIVTKPQDITQAYDIVHVFNFLTYKISEQFIYRAKELNIKVVSSSIYWDYSYAATKTLNDICGYPEFVSEHRVKLQRKLVTAIGLFLPKPTGVSSCFKKSARWMFDNSDIVAPNSVEESKLLLEWIQRENNVSKIRTVVNATTKEETNSEKKDYSQDAFCAKYGIPDNYILQVGRIEYTKNQLNLIGALLDNPEIPIVFVGKIIDQKYYKKLSKIAMARGNVYFIDAVPYDEIKYFYRYAKLHVLLSLRESPGLVNIEALVNNCPIVISDSRFMPVKTYFEHQPYIVNPLDKEDTKKTILKALRERTVGEFDIDKFTWEVAAKQTFNIYEELIIKN